MCGIGAQGLGTLIRLHHVFLVYSNDFLGVGFDLRKQRQKLREIHLAASIRVGRVPEGSGQRLIATFGFPDFIG